VQANPTRIRKRWSQAKPKKSRVFWIAIDAIVLTRFLGFTRGGWTTDGSASHLAKASAQSAVVERLASICVAQFNTDAQSVVRLQELNALSSSSKRTAYVTEQGWATMPGETAPDKHVATECTKQLVLIGG